MLLNSTPIERYVVKGCPVFVKREDLCVGEGMPTFSKVRGLLPYLEKVKKSGIDTIGYVESAISMAGWGVAWACRELDLKAVIFYPVYKQPVDLLLFHKSQWEYLGATVVDIKAGMVKVNWNICRKIMKDSYTNWELLPLGIPFEESIQATCNEFIKVLDGLITPKTVVVNVGSGTILSGIWRAVNELQLPITVYGVMGRTGNVLSKIKKVQQKSKTLPGLFSKGELIMIDPGWFYMDKSEIYCPFPCHPYYDLKAWEWLIDNIEGLPVPILFWNIGSLPLKSIK